MRSMNKGSARSGRTFGSKLRKRCEDETGRNSQKNYGYAVNKQPGRGLRIRESLLAEVGRTDWPSRAIFLGSLPSPSRPRAPFRVSSGVSPVPCSWRRVPRRTPCGFAVPRGNSAGCVPCGARLPTCRLYGRF